MSVATLSMDLPALVEGDSGVKYSRPSGVTERWSESYTYWSHGKRTVHWRWNAVVIKGLGRVLNSFKHALVEKSTPNDEGSPRVTLKVSLTGLSSHKLLVLALEVLGGAPFSELILVLPHSGPVSHMQRAVLRVGIIRGFKIGLSFN